MEEKEVKEVKEEGKKFAFMKKVNLPTLPTLSGLPVKRFAIVGGLILVALIAGIVVGEIGLVGQALASARTAIVGRVPLEWMLIAPASIVEEDGYTAIVSSYGQGAAVVAEWASPSEGGTSAKYLQLEVVPNSDLLYLEITVKYVDGDRDSLRFTDVELAAVAKASGEETALLKFLLAEKPVARVLLGIEGQVPSFSLEIVKAELRLR